MPEYRQLIGSVVWHFRRDCSAWPSQNFGVLGNPVDGEICTECTCLGVLHRTCPVIVNNNLCGLEPIRNSDGLYYCPVGHRTRLVEIGSKYLATSMRSSDCSGVRIILLRIAIGYSAGRSLYPAGDFP